MEKENEYSKMPAIEKIIFGNFKKYKFPIISAADFGHCTPNIPIPYGKLASVDGDKKNFEFWKVFSKKRGQMNDPLCFMLV